MITTIRNFDDSLWVQFPEPLLQNFQIFENDDVEILVKNNNIVIKPHKDKTHLSTKDRIAAFYDAADNILSSEVEWGTPQGEEIW